VQTERSIVTQKKPHHVERDGDIGNFVVGIAFQMNELHFLIRDRNIRFSNGDCRIDCNRGSSVSSRGDLMFRFQKMFCTLAKRKASLAASAWYQPTALVLLAHSEEKPMTRMMATGNEQWGPDVFRKCLKFRSFFVLSAV